MFVCVEVKTAAFSNPLESSSLNCIHIVDGRLVQNEYKVYPLTARLRTSA